MTRYKVYSAWYKVYSAWYKVYYARVQSTKYIQHGVKNTVFNLYTHPIKTLFCKVNCSTHYNTLCAGGE